MKRWAWNLSARRRWWCSPSALGCSSSVGSRVSILNEDRNQPDPGTTPQWYGFSDYHFACSRGEILFARIRLDSDNFGIGFQMTNGIRRPATTLLSPNSAFPTSVSFAGFELYHVVNPLQSLTIQYHAVALPLWLFFFAAIPPWLWWRRRPARRFHGFPITPTPMAQITQ